MIRRLKNKDKRNFLDFCQTKDVAEDFYIVKDNQRVFLTDQRVALYVFNNCLKHGDICYVWDEKEEIKGVFLILGYSEKITKKYVKVLANTEFILRELFKYFAWVYNNEVYFNFNIKNPALKMLQHPYDPKRYRRGYKVIETKESQILLMRSKHDNNTQNYKKPNRRPDTKRWQR